MEAVFILVGSSLPPLPHPQFYHDPFIRLSLLSPLSSLSSLSSLLLSLCPPPTHGRTTSYCTHIKCISKWCYVLVHTTSAGFSYKTEADRPACSRGWLKSYVTLAAVKLLAHGLFVPAAQKNARLSLCYTDFPPRLRPLTAFSLSSLSSLLSPLSFSSLSPLSSLLSPAPGTQFTARGFGWTDKEIKP